MWFRSLSQGSSELNHLVWPLLLLLTPACGNVHANPIPGIPDSGMVGSGELTWFGMTVYTATLYAPNGIFRPEDPHALRIDYRFKFSRSELALSSLNEIRKLRDYKKHDDAMRASLESVFTDVAEGDHIIGVHHPGDGAAFYSAGEPLGRIDDPVLAQAFFSIWLSPDTSEPGLRAQLLGPPQ
jgi:hypothetical protein